ncbi:MAG: hypothetical protein ABSB35_16470 [Bryobacteraceae bacterium]|jgi:hypothetical protein
MNKLANIKIVKKLGLGALISAVLLACVAGLAQWALNDSTAAVAKVELYAHKLLLAQRLDSNLSELALLMSSLPTSRHVAQVAERVQAVGKEYTADLEYLKTSQTYLKFSDQAT